jgi:hypothetical protein
MKTTELLAAAVAVVAMCAVSDPSRAEARSGGTQEVRLERLFDVRLQHAEGVEVAPLGEREGQLIGGGTGTVDGAKIKGQVVRWSNFERTLTEGLCALQVPAEIRTDDGAEIKFEALGNALVPDKAQPNKWINAMTLRFQTDDARYRWLNTTLGVWEGEFDLQTGVSTGRVYARLRGGAHQ